MSLLDDMLADHSESKKKARSQPPAARRDPEGPSRRAGAAAVNAMAEELERRRREQRRKEWNEAEARTRERQSLEPVEMCEMHVGDQFRLRHARQEIAGVWQVIKIDPGAAGDQSRQLTAQRPTGGEMILQFTERQLMDALYGHLMERM